MSATDGKGSARGTVAAACDGDELGAVWDVVEGCCGGGAALGCDDCDGSRPFLYLRRRDEVRRAGVGRAFESPSTTCCVFPKCPSVRPGVSSLPTSIASDLPEASSCVLSTSTSGAAAGAWEWVISTRRSTSG